MSIERREWMELVAVMRAEESLRKQYDSAACKLEKLIWGGGRIAFQDGKWWVFDFNGEGIHSGNTIVELLRTWESH